MFVVRPVLSSRKAHLHLLLLADPDETMLDRYLTVGDMYVGLEDDQVVCEAVMLPLSHGICELKNLATEPDRQNCGYAGRLVDELSRMYAERGFQTMLVGTSVTGTGFYERLGFVPSHIVPNFFTDNYAEPVLDDGVLCIDMHYLKKKLS